VGNKDSWYVFQPDPFEIRSQVANDDCKVVPQLAVLPDDTGALSGDRVIRAGETGNESSHAATIEFAWEGSYVRPDRRLIQRAFFSPCSQNFGGFNVDLDIADAASSWLCNSHSEVEPSESGEAGHIVFGM
jgi:hypothetical protein